MNWRRKAQIQNVIARLPMSDQIYYAVQRAAGGLRPGCRNQREWFEAALMMVKLAKSEGHEVAGKRFLEVGTGRALNVPIALWLCGAEEIVTVDLNRYLSKTMQREVLDYVRHNEKEVRELLAEAVPQDSAFDARLRQLVRFDGDLDALMKLSNIRYLAPADARQLPFAEGSFDFHISHAVFEHIPSEVLRNILREARRILVPGGLLIHIIDPSDHASHDDPSVSTINFLQYDDCEWDRIAGNKYMYHNRLRAFELLRLFEEAGIEILQQRQAVDQAALTLLESGFQVDEQFSDIPFEKLAVRSLTVVGTPVAQ